MSNKIVVVVGPTSSGKSDLAVKIAKKWNGEVISVDSRQVYLGMDIGSGKVPRDENHKSQITNSKQIQNLYLYNGVRHYLLDVASPKRTFTVAQFKSHAERAMRNILIRGKLPIVAGGTAFWIDALIYDMKIPEVKPNATFRKKLECLSCDTLFAKLKEMDPRRARNIDFKNKRRIIRALEIIDATGEPVPPAKANYKKHSNILVVGISPHEKSLHKRIAKRLQSRLAKGMIHEVNQLHKNGVSWRRLDNLGLEYRWVSRYIRGLITKTDMEGTLEREIRKYAKHQMRWWKRNPNIVWTKNCYDALDVVTKFIRK